MTLISSVFVETCHTIPETTDKDRVAYRSYHEGVPRTESGDDGAAEEASNKQDAFSALVHVHLRGLQ